MEVTFFAQIMLISVILACVAYPVLMADSDLPHVIKAIWFLIVLITILAIFNYEMDVMSNKNVEVFDALYNTPWYACDIKFRRMVLNGMTFSQNPIWIRGMGLLDVRASKATFYSALVRSYNILNVFRNIE
uniref:Odorant receptor 43a n=1 Tax=Lygus hesperus TaxID=30085 RepID=A0A0A9Y8T7_LYGHE